MHKNLEKQVRNVYRTKKKAKEEYEYQFLESGTNCERKLESNTKEERKKEEEEKRREKEK